jgi:hypothetical protein
VKWPNLHHRSPATFATKSALSRLARANWPCPVLTYQTSLGFYDLAIATLFMKMAPEARGAGGDLFHQGFAQGERRSGRRCCDYGLPGRGCLSGPAGSNSRFAEHSDLKLPTPHVGSSPTRPVKLRHTDVLRSSGLFARRFGQDSNELVDHPTEPRMRCELPIYESPPGSINLNGKPCLSPQSSANTECAKQCSEVFGNLH